MRPFIEAIRPMFPFVTLFITTTVWVMFSRNDILSKEPRILFLLFGTIFSNISVSHHLNQFYLPFSYKIKSKFYRKLVTFHLVPPHCRSNVRYSGWRMESFNVPGDNCYWIINCTTWQIRSKHQYRSEYWKGSPVLFSCYCNANTFSFWLWSG